jgi:hypothetical protein
MRMIMGFGGMERMIMLMGPVLAGVVVIVGLNFGTV